MPLHINCLITEQSTADGKYQTVDQTKSTQFNIFQERRSQNNFYFQTELLLFLRKRFIDCHKKDQNDWKRTGKEANI